MPKRELSTKTVRLPKQMVALATIRAAESGLNFNDVVEMALADLLNLPKNRSYAVLEAVRAHLLGVYPNRVGFPRDVTLQVFRFLRADAKARALYTAAISDNDGEADDSRRDALHRRIGKAVKVVLNAKVVGRSLPLDAALELIRTHALLEPAGI